MNVLFIGPGLGAGGAERQWSILIPGLRERGIDARVIALDSGGVFVEPLRATGVPVEVLLMRHQADLPRLARSRLIRHFDPDVIVSRSVSGLYVGQALSRVRRAPHVYNEHKQVGMAMSRRREAMTRLVCRHLERVVAVSGDQATEWLHRGYPADRIVVIPNGVPPFAVTEPRQLIRGGLGIPESATVVLLVASLRPEKRVPDFVQAVRWARESNSDLLGVVVGDGVDRDAVSEAAGGDAAVRLLGQRDDVPRLLAAADMFALISDYEALPMSILEAMAAGLPVIATGVGAIPELVADGVSGVLVPPRDTAAIIAALLRLASSPDLRAAMGAEAARHHREHWSAAAMIDGYEGVLRGLGPSRRRRPRPRELRRTTA
jgi:glycosyltransferase involved in cell wall biosynthesis